MRSIKTAITIILLFSISPAINAQETGDTIVVETFNYSQTYGINQWSPGIRDSIIQFPDAENMEYSKILMRYNIRCKDGNVSPGITGQTDVGCGEWDASCNTYIHDSTRIDSVIAFAPSHLISGFESSTYNYTSQPTYSYYQHNLQEVEVTNVTNEAQYNLGDGIVPSETVLQIEQPHHKSQYILTAEELINLGLQTGEINAIGIDNVGGDFDINFMRVKMGHVLYSEFENDNLEMGDLQEVYFNHETIQSGMQTLQFYSPFSWDGSSNIIVELSSTAIIGESEPSTISSSDIGMNRTLHSTEDNYIQVNGAERIDIPEEALSTISAEVTISFWVDGKDGLLGDQTTIMGSEDESNNRQLTIHLPWDNQVYFDCGGDSNGFDRINK